MGLCSSSNQLDPLPPTMTREKSTTNRKNNRKIKPIKEDTVDNSVDCLELSGQLETAVAKANYASVSFDGKLWNTFLFLCFCLTNHV